MNQNCHQLAVLLKSAEGDFTQPSYGDNRPTAAVQNADATDYITQKS
jgi:hypothetical protein